ncbi:MAG: branched-chain amino acid ABC transporter permease [Desulfomonilia bacterium]
MKRLLIVLGLLFLPPLVFRGEYAYFLSIMTIGSIYAIVAMSLNLLLGYTGQISLCHAAFFGVGAYGAAMGTAVYSMAPWIGLVLAMVFPGIIALAIGLPTVRLREHYLAMATLGIGIIVYAVLRANPCGATGGPGGIFGIPSLSILGYSIASDTSHHLLVAVMVLIIFLLSETLISSRFGTAMQAIHGSPTAALSLGIDVNRVKLKVFILSASMAGLAGGLYAFCSPLSYVNPDEVASVMLSVKFIVMVVIGGSSSLLGGILGAFLITWLPEFLRTVLHSIPFISPTDLEAIIYGVVLIVILIYAPQGLISWRERRADG